jgi:hypothetical protein
MFHGQTKERNNMGLFDRFFGAKEKALAALAAAPARGVNEPPVPRVKAVPKTAKQLATEANEPYVAVLRMDVDPNNLHQGAFELDWNEIFVARLVKAGYMMKKDDADSDLVDRWFQNVCRHVVMETWEQEQAIKNSGVYVQTRNIGDGRSEVS